MGERTEDVHLVGCPRIDLVVEIMRDGTDGLSDKLFDAGVGGRFDLNEPFLIVSQHPVTTEYGDGEQQITETLMAVERLGLPAIVLWPNADAGAEHVARGICKFRESHDCSRLHFFKNIPFETYIALMVKAASIVGNSSAAVREGALIGVPAVNVGTRQQGRQRGSNLVDVGYHRTAIADAIERQVKRGRYEGEPIYGDGQAGERIAQVLSTCTIRLQKQITY